MESRKDMVMFLDGGQLGTLVGKRVSNLSEAVGSPLPEPPEKMVPRGCLSPRAGPPATRERGGGGLEEEPVDGLSGSAAGPGTEPRAAGAATLGPGPPAPSVDSLSVQGQPSSSDTESDFYEEIEVSCTPDCATGNAEYQHSKGSHRAPPLPRPPTAPTFHFCSGGEEDTPFPQGRIAGGAGGNPPKQLSAAICALSGGLLLCSGIGRTEGDSCALGVRRRETQVVGLRRIQSAPQPPEFCGTTSTAPGRYLPPGWVRSNADQGSLWLTGWKAHPGAEAGSP